MTRGWPAIALVLLATSAVPARAGGGWIPGRGLSYLEFSLTSTATSTTYDAEGRPIPFRRISDFDRPTTFRDRALNAYAEAGLGGHWALDGAVSWKRVEVEEPATRFVSEGPADLRLVLRRGLRAERPALAVSLGASAPLGYVARDYPSLGSGEFDVTALAHGGWGFGGGWAEAAAGYRRRGGIAADELPFTVQLGVRLHPRWTGTLALDGHRRVRGYAAAEADANYDPARASSSVLLGGPTLVRSLDAHLSLSLAAWRTIEGRNMPAGWKWKLALARTR